LPSKNGHYAERVRDRKRWLAADRAYNPVECRLVLAWGVVMQDNQQVSRARPAHKAALPVFLGAVVILAAVAYLHEGGAPAGGDGDLPHLAQVHGGAVAPGFRATALSGRTIRLPDAYRGKLVLVDFWATWCPPCVGEFPHLLAAYEKFHERGFEILGISLDAPNGIAARRVRSFLEQRKVPWDVIYDGAAPIAGDYRVVAIPAAFLVDGDTGRILASGQQTRGDALFETIERALKSRSDG
jgi:thiol-disulfide isomerase/thioredoxin